MQDATERLIWQALDLNHNPLGIMADITLYIESPDKVACACAFACAIHPQRWTWRANTTGIMFATYTRNGMYPHVMLMMPAEAVLKWMEESAA